MVDEPCNCKVVKQSGLTADINQLQENICCIDKEACALGMYREVPVAELVSVLTSMSANMMSLARIVKSIERKVLKMESEG